ncbi:MAG: MBL fold metallo-hydrolase [Streptosporangiales bacterium]|nr:MBL fold metallo-hydrolase [Streptosporangiales bacterium]
MTLDGTNTWVLAEPGASHVAVVDPGPGEQPHLRRVAGAVRSSGRSVGVVLLTHGHADHAEGAGRFAELVDAPVRAADPALCVDGEPLADGSVVTVDGLSVSVVATPGHTADSVCFHLPADALLLTGDTVLGRGTTVVAYPDGSLAAYLDSLRRMRALASSSGLRLLLPAHGPALDDPVGALDGYLAHRAERLAQVRSAVAEGAREPMDVVRTVYADVDPAVWSAAEASVRAQLDYLRDTGEAVP